jgi:hypothetical protein
MFADKIAVRDYVAEIVGPEFLTRIYEVFNSAHDLDLSKAPINFVLKPNHVSGAALIVSDYVPESANSEYFSQRFLNKYYVNPNSIDLDKVHKLCDFWLRTNYFGYHRSAFPEWAYKEIAPRIYMEELLSSNNQPPEDFRFFMFNGSCQVIMVDTPGFTGVRRDIYSPGWDLLDVKFKYDNSNIKRQKPDSLTQMIDIAEKLANGADHLRVDLYNLDGRIVFSELTNYHAGGTQKFIPSSFDSELGVAWNPKSSY